MPPGGLHRLPTPSGQGLRTARQPGLQPVPPRQVRPAAAPCTRPGPQARHARHRHMPTRATLVVDQRHDPPSASRGRTQAPRSVRQTPAPGCHREREPGLGHPGCDDRTGVRPDPQRELQDLRAPALHAARASAAPTPWRALAELVADRAAWRSVARFAPPCARCATCCAACLASIEAQVWPIAIRWSAPPRWMRCRQRPVYERLPPRAPLLAGSLPVAGQGQAVRQGSGASRPTPRRTLPPPRGRACGRSSTHTITPRNNNITVPESRTTSASLRRTWRHRARDRGLPRRAFALQPDFAPAYANSCRAPSPDRPGQPRRRHPVRRPAKVPGDPARCCTRKRRLLPGPPGDLPEALDLLAPAARGDPANPRYAYILAVALHDESGRRAEALSTAARTRPTSPATPIANAFEAYRRASDRGAAADRAPMSHSSARCGIRPSRTLLVHHARRSSNPPEIQEP